MVITDVIISWKWSKRLSVLQLFICIFNTAAHTVHPNEAWLIVGIDLCSSKTRLINGKDDVRWLNLRQQSSISTTSTTSCHTAEVVRDVTVHVFAFLTFYRVNTERTGWSVSLRVSTVSCQIPLRCSLLKMSLSCRARWGISVFCGCSFDFCVLLT